MADYDDPTLTYDDISVTYKGADINTPLTVFAGEVDVTEEVRDLSVRVGVHGNSRGTFDTNLYDPASVPSLGDIVKVFVQQKRLFNGTVKTADETEFKGGHVTAKVSAQDDGFDPGTLTTVAPFGLSDDDSADTIGYRSLRRQTRLTDEGSERVTYQAVVTEHGLWAGQDIEVTAANYGLSAEEFAINEAALSWANENEPPVYELTLGDAILKLVEVIEAAPIADGSITTAKLEDAPNLLRIVADASLTLTLPGSGPQLTDAFVDISGDYGGVLPMVIGFRLTDESIGTPIPAMFVNILTSEILNFTLSCQLITPDSLRVAVGALSTGTSYQGNEYRFKVYVLAQTAE